MFEPTITIFGFTFRTYTFLLSLVISGAIGGLMWRVPHRGAVMDASLGGLLGGLAGGRLLYVLFHWSYFAYHPAEMTALHLGGLDWRGALMGAVAGMHIVARWRGVSFGWLLDRLTLVLPLLMLAAWWGCGTALCAWGAEVERMAAYPNGLTWEAMDGFGLLVPRFQTQGLGMAAALALSLLALGLMGVRQLAGRRFWLMLFALCAADAALSLLRGDFAPIVAGLRAEVWLNLWLGLAALGLAARARHPGSVVSNV